MTLLDYAHDELKGAGVPLHVEEVSVRILARQGGVIQAANWHSLNKLVNTEIRVEGEAARFHKSGRSCEVALAAWRGRGGRD